MKQNAELMSKIEDQSKAQLDEVNNLRGEVKALAKNNEELEAGCQFLSSQNANLQKMIQGPQVKTREMQLIIEEGEQRQLKLEQHFKAREDRLKAEHQ